MYILLLTLLACGQKTDIATAVPRPTEQEVESTTSAETVLSVEEFGAEFTLEESISAAIVLNSPEEYVGQKVRITGTVGDVCQKMGCWMVITEQDKHMRITTKDHNFFVAKDGAGSACDVEGLVVKRELDPERVEHFASEQSEGAPLPEASAVNNVTYEIVAEAILFTTEIESTEATSE